ncbi:MAG: hypothetical protein KA497_02050 [Clostridia bacterium]|nr:hypothetical protein [Clostridia bacterium]
MNEILYVFIRLVKYIVADHAVFHGEGTAVLIDVRAAFVLGGVAPQDRVCQCRIGVYVEHPTAVNRLVAGEGAVYHRRAGVIVLHPAAVNIRRVA